MIIGIYGFGIFGKFLYRYLEKYGFDILITSIENISHSKYMKEEDFFNTNMDMIFFCNSINSFNEVIGKIINTYPEFFKNKLIIDVLSVKEYPLDIYKKYNINENIVLTHPMFGPNSVNDNELWNNKKFIYWPINITLSNYYEVFMNFLSFTECEKILMDPQTHDKYVANSQFITHFIGNSLKELNLNDTPINTMNYDNMLKLINNISNDSIELFKGMTNKNKYTLDVMKQIIYSIHKTFNTLIPQKTIYSATSMIMDKIKKTDKQIINAAIGVPTWAPPIQNVISSDTFDSSYSLSGGNIDLKKAIVGFFNNKLTIDNIVITPGGKPALFCSIQALTSIGSKWLVPSPYWVSYPDMIRMVHGHTIILESEVKNNWLFDLSEVEKYYNDPAVNGIIICNPNNPTGLLYSDEFLNQLVRLTDQYNKKIIVDEVYMPLISSNDLNYKNSLIFDQNIIRQNVIAIWSFSKGWGLAGWRVGFALGNSELIKKITGIQSTINTCPPTSSQQIALKLLTYNWLPVEEFKKIDKYKNQLIDIYREKGWEVADNPVTGMYIFPINRNIDINQYIDTLFSKGLAVISGEPFGNKHGIRLTIYNDAKIMDRYIDIIKNT